MREAGTQGRWSPKRAAAASCVLFVVALAVRLAYLSQLANTPYANELELLADARYYDMRAREIASGGIVPEAPGLLSPLYCYVVGAVYAVSPGLASVKLVQAWLGAFTTVVLFLIGRRLWSDGVGLAAGAVLALHGLHVFYTGLMLPTVSIVLLNLLVVLAASGKRTPLPMIVTGLLVGAATMAKPNAVLLLPALGAWLLLTERPWRRGLVPVAWIVAAAVVFLTPITIANWRLTGSVVLVTTTGGTNLLKGNGPDANGSYAFTPPGAKAGSGLAGHRAGIVDGPTAVKRDRERTREALAYMASHPARTAGLWVKKSMLLLNARELSIRDDPRFVERFIPALGWGVPFWLVAIPGVAGALLRLGDWRRLGAVYAMMAVQLVSFVLLFVIARYRLVLVACLMPFAVELIASVWARIRRGELARLRVPAAVLAAVTVIVFFPFSEFSQEQGAGDQYAFIGDRQYERGDFTAAAEAYTAALESDWQVARRSDAERRKRIRARLALSWMELGRLDDARELARELIPEAGATELSDASLADQLRSMAEQRVRAAEDSFEP